MTTGCDRMISRTLGYSTISKYSTHTHTLRCVHTHMSNGEFVAFKSAAVAVNGAYTVS